MALNLSAEQSATINSVETNVEEAFSNGVTGTGLSPTVDPVTSYTDANIMTSALKKTTKDYLKAGIASLVATFPSTRFSGTVALAKLTVLGSNGSMTIVDGFVTAYTAPT